MNPIAPSGPRRLVRCAVGTDTYCIDSDWLDSIQVIENLYPSRSSDGSVGWIRRFDEKVPVFRLADQVHGAPRGSSRQGVIMVLRREEKLWALLVDKVTAAGDVPAERVFPLPAIVARSGGHFPYVIVEDDGIMLYLSPDRVVPAGITGVSAPVLAKTAPALPSKVRPGIRQLSTLSPAEAAQAASRAGRQLIAFSLVHESPLGVPVRFAITAGQALEIVSGLPLTQVPNSPPFIAGLSCWRSQPVPVVDLGMWLGMAPAPHTPGCRFLMCRGTIGRGPRDAGLLAIPAVDDIRKLDLPIEYQAWPHAVSWNESLALGIYRAERNMLIVPDLDAILSFQDSSGYRM
jgi:purine-binding chemotaxis protein CheW